MELSLKRLLPIVDRLLPVLDKLLPVLDNVLPALINRFDSILESILGDIASAGIFSIKGPTVRVIGLCDSPSSWVVRAVLDFSLIDFLRERGACDTCDCDGDVSEVSAV